MDIWKDSTLAHFCSWIVQRINKACVESHLYRAIDLAVLHEIPSCDTPLIRVSIFTASIVLLAGVDVLAQIELHVTKSDSFTSAPASVFLNHFKMNEALLQHARLVDGEPDGNDHGIRVVNFVVFDGILRSAPAMLRRSAVREMPFYKAGAADERNVVQIYYLLRLWSGKFRHDNVDEVPALRWSENFG